MGLWRKTRKFQLSPVLHKVLNPLKPLLIHQKIIWLKPVLSVEEVTVISALVTLLDFYFSKNRNNMFNNSPSPKSLNLISQAQNVSKSGIFSNISNSTAILFSKILSRYSFLYNQMLSGHIFNSLHQLILNAFIVPQVHLSFLLGMF